MPEQSIDMGLVSAPPAAAPAAAPAQQTSPAAAPRAAPQAPAPVQRVTPGTPEWAALSAEQRHAALRGPENPRARGHSPHVEQREAAAAKAANPADQPAAVDPNAPEHSTERLRVGRYEVSEAELASMMDRQAQDDLKKLTLPPAPEAYEAKLPEGLKLPGGIEYKWNESDPTMIAARNMAHAKGWSQADFSDALGLFASHTAAQEAALAARSAAEVAKAGVNAPQRVDAVGKFITGLMGEADAKQIKALIVTDSMLRYHEAIMSKLSSQGAASFSQSHRTAPETNGIPGYEKMTFEQRRQAQDINASRRR
jgi:hypothetical protein